MIDRVTGLGRGQAVERGKAFRAAEADNHRTSAVIPGQSGFEEDRRPKSVPSTHAAGRGVPAEAALLVRGFAGTSPSKWLSGLANIPVACTHRFGGLVGAQMLPATKSMVATAALIAVLALPAAVLAAKPSQPTTGNSPAGPQDQTRTDTLKIGDISRFSRRDGWQLVVGTYDGALHLLEHNYTSDQYIDISDVHRFVPLSSDVKVVIDKDNGSNSLFEAASPVPGADDGVTISALSISDFAENLTQSTITQHDFWDNECINLPGVITIADKSEAYSFTPLIKDPGNNELCGADASKGWGIPATYLSPGSVDEVVGTSSDIYIVARGAIQSYIIEVPRSIKALKSLKVSENFITSDDYLLIISNLLKKNESRYAAAPTRNALADEFFQKRRISAPYLITVDVEQALNRYVQLHISR